MLRRRPVPVACRAVVLAAVALAMAGCGGSDEAEPESRPSASPSTDPAVEECREQWRDLAAEVEDELAADTGEPTDTPSGLRARWVTVTAQIDYYAASGAAGDCEETLAQERRTIAALQDFTKSLAPLDVERALGGYERDLAAYARPSGREGRAAPTGKQVERALDDLRELAPRVASDQAAGWQQAAVTDVADAKARRKAVADLRVLSGESRPFRRAERVTAVLDRAVEAVDERPGAARD